MADDRRKNKGSRSIDNDPLIQQARLAEEKRIKDAEEKRKAELARAKKLREIGGAISRGPKNLGELTERGLGAVVTGFGNQIKSDEATRDAQYAEEKARAAASAYAKNPTDSNRSKYQTAKGRFEKATDNYKKVTGKTWPKSGVTEVKTETPSEKSPTSKQDTKKTPEIVPLSQDKTIPKLNTSTGNAVNDLLGSLGVSFSGQTAVAPVKPVAPKPTGDFETDRENRRIYEAAMDAYQIKLDAYSNQVKPEIDTDGPSYQRPTTSVQKSVTQYTAQQVKGLANQAFQEAIGREASADELTKFLNALNKAEKDSPRVTVSKPSGSTTSGGIDPQQLAVDTARDNPEFANYQKATTYFDTMLSTLRGPVGGGI
jgi:hypothetical protein